MDAVLKPKKFRNVIFLLVVVTLLAFTVHHQTNSFRKINLKGNSVVQTDKPHLVLGILSGAGNKDLRDGQRNTWLSAIHAQINEIPFRVTYKFLIDRPTNETVLEHRHHGDLFYLNSSHTGRGRGFGEKLHKWFKHINETYPDVALGAKMDDDVFLCIPQLFLRIKDVMSPTLYYGWKHGQALEISHLSRIDEMFLVLGKKLIHRIVGREYCYGAKCDSKQHLIDTNFGGTSMGVWLSQYKDVDFQQDNKRIFHKGRDALKIIPKFVDENTCKKYVLFHKSSVQIMYQLNGYNQHSNVS